MRKWILTAAVAGLALGAAAPAAKAEPWGYGSYRGGYGGERHHRRGFDGGDALVGGAIGLAAGALIGSALAAPRQPAPVYVDPYADPYGRPTYARPAYREPVYVEPPTYEDTIPQRVYRAGPRRVEYGDRSQGDHVESCLSRYGSYDPRSDTFLGYDGYRHRCNL